MSTTGALSDSDTSGKLTGQAASTIFKLDLVKTYKLLSVAGNTYLQTNNALFLLNPDTKMFENFNVPISNYKITASGDGKNLIFWNDGHGDFSSQLGAFLSRHSGETKKAFKILIINTKI